MDAIPQPGSDAYACRVEPGVVVGADPIERWQTPPRLVLGTAAAMVVAIMTLLALFPRSDQGSVLRSEAQSAVAPDLEQWKARYEASNRAPVGVDAPLGLPGGLGLTSLSVWQPGLYVEGTVVYRVLIGEDGSWMFVSADPTSRLEERRDAAVAIPGLATLRSAAGEDPAVLEWDDAGYTVRIEGSGLAIEDMERVAAGVRLPTATSIATGHAMELGFVPGGFSLSGPSRSEPGTVGPGDAGWHASYLREGPIGQTVTITAAEDAAYPFSELFGLVPAHQTRIRGYWGLAFDAPAESNTAVRSRLLWFEEGALLEATSDHLSTAELLATLEPLELRHPEARVMRTSIARTRLGFGRRGFRNDSVGGPSAAELLDIIMPLGPRP